MKVLSVVSILLHVFELFPDSYKTDGDILCGDAHDLADFIIAEILKPKKDDRTVERSEFPDPFLQ